jgi:hypothetical protein
VQDFEGQIRTLSGGSGLMDNAAFAAGTRNQPLGDRKAGISADLDALAAYVASLNQVDNSPWRAANGALNAAATAGKLVFDNRGCADCHGGASFTSSSLNGGMRNVGTLKAGSRNRLGAPLTGLDAPTLRGLWATAPYLHDGSAATLAAAVAAHAGNPVPAAEMVNLVAYLNSIDGRDMAPVQALPDGVYRLVAQHSGKTLNVAGINPADGAAAIQWPWLGGDNERWKLTRQADGSVTLAAQHSGKLLEVAGCSAADGARVQQWAATGAACQRWRPQAMADGSFRLANAASGKLLNINGASVQDGAGAIQWPASNTANERWRLEPVSAHNVAAGAYSLSAVHSQKVLDVVAISPAAGANVQQWPGLNGPNQQWRVSPSADGFFELAPVHAPGMRLEVAAGAAGNGGNVQQGLASGTAAQRWNFERQADGNWRLTNLNSGRVLDVANISNGDGANVHQWDWLNGANQRWRLQAVATTPQLLVSGQAVSFEPMTWAGYRIRHANFQGFISAVSAASPALDKQDSSFIARPGLAQAACWSFESTNYPGHYLRQANFRLVLTQRPAPAPEAYDAEATFCQRAPLNVQAGANALSLESFSTPGRFVHHRNFQVWLDADDGDPRFPGDSSFRVLAPLP